MSSGRPPTLIGSPLTRAVSRSMRETVPSPAFVTHRKRSPTARASGARPTGIDVVRPSLIRSTAFSPDATTHTAAFATTGLSGCRPAGMAAPARRVEPGALGGGGPALAAAPQTSEPATVMPSGPRPARIVAATEGCRPAVVAGGAVGPVPDTNFATASISAADKRPLNDGMTPAPEVTIPSTVSALGFASSRFGPVAPDEPAAASV